MPTVTAPAAHVDTGCPLCGQILGDPRLIYLAEHSGQTAQPAPARVCLRCYLALSPQESAARAALGIGA